MVEPDHDGVRRQLAGTERLIEAVQLLSLARDIDSIREIVRHAARELTGADGATFILRDGDCCHYVDEYAIGPLWKGRRFSMTSCISGWAMLHREAALIEDIYVDPRVPVDAYRPTFVKSLAMVPIRRSDPIGAIGNYWAERHQPEPGEVRLLQALADSTSIAIENVQLYAGLEQRVRERTAQLEAANRELEAFSYSVSHDLRSPLRAIDGFSEALASDCGDQLDARGRSHLERVRAATRRMSALIDDLLELSRLARATLERSTVDVSALAREIAAELHAHDPGRDVSVRVTDGLTASADPGLLRAALENLIGNAWKFTAKRAGATIEIGRSEDGERAFFVRDDGAGFDAARADNLFAPFQRFHDTAEFPGTGVGLVTVQRVIARHGGRIWAESAPGEGATFLFTLAGSD